MSERDAVDAGDATAAVPTLSVVVPLFDKAAYVERCLRSIRAQTRSPLEIIVVDDGSHDDGPERARALLRPQDRLVRQANAGVAAARNAGAALARGTLVSFLDADDEWHPDFCRAVLELAERWPRLAFYGTGYRQLFPGGECVDLTAYPLGGEAVEDGRLIVGDYFDRITAGPFLCTISVAFRQADFRAVGGYAVGVTHGEDLDLHARLALRSPIGYDRRVLASYWRDVPDSAMRSEHADPLAPLIATVDATLERSSLGPEQREALERYRAFLCRRRVHLLAAHGAWDAIRGLRDARGRRAAGLLARAAAALAVTRPLLRMRALAARVPTSRAWLRLRMGTRRAGGVETRLGHVSGSAPSPTPR